MRTKQPRLTDARYLRWLRRQPCACGCGAAAPSDAAHIRSGSLAMGKPWTGMGEKPSDFWAVPLSRACHTRQHLHGDELGWWTAHGRDPFKLAITHYAAFQAENPAAPKTKPARGKIVDGGFVISPRKIKPRKPRHLRAKIANRNTLRKAP